MSAIVTVQYNRILHSVILLLRHNINHNLYSQQTPHSSSSRASYGVSIVSNLEKIDRVVMALWFIMEKTSVK